MAVQGVGVRQVPAGVDPDRPAPARIYDYLLSGENNFPADREAAEKITALVPELRDCAWANRGFHQRAARWIAQQGIRQFIDIGSGLPTVGNTHEVVHRVDPDCRVVYADNDPMVRAQASELLAGQDGVRVILGDLRDPDRVLGHPDVRELIARTPDPPVIFPEPSGLFTEDSGTSKSRSKRFGEPLALARFRPPYVRYHCYGAAHSGTS